MDNFITPKNHINFSAKKLFDKIDMQIIDGSIAYLQKDGGGPTKAHTHEHDHLFIVTKGEAKILEGEKTIILHENESYLVKGNSSHSIWNNADDETIMIGISLK